MGFLLHVLILVGLPICSGYFSPDTTDYDAYGLKVAGNNLISVESQPDNTAFFILFPPYNNVSTGQQCSLDYDNGNDYVYSVGVGFQASDSNFYAIGQVVTGKGQDADLSGGNATFIAYYNATNDLQCGQIARTIISEIPFLPDDFLVMVVHPTGKFALGLAPNFVFRFNPSGSPTLITKTSIWSNSSFTPRAADIDTNFTIVAGIRVNSASSRALASVVVYLIDNTLSHIYSTWTYVPKNNSWQSLLKFSGYDSWSVKYTMSVDINNYNPTRVLVGVPCVNTVFHFIVGGGGTTLNLTDQRSSGNSVGFGKGVAWIASDQAAILANIYTSTFSSWLSSQIWVYTQLPSTSLASTPTAIIPNSQQPIPSTISSELINLVSTPNGLIVLDVSGGVLFILSTPPSHYASTDPNLALGSIAIPSISTTQRCLAGMMKSDTGIHPCSLCPMGWRSSVGSINCTVCNASTFCPPGAVAEVSQTELQTISQAYPYYENPDTTLFDDVLLNNVFHIGSTRHCVAVSPIFWTLIILIPLLALMGILFMCQQCSRSSHDSARMKTIKKWFKRTDLVAEGENWIGGLFTLALIVLLIQTYVFANNFMFQYPAASVGNSNFACDVTLRNALFDTSLKSLAIPPSSEEQDMFDLLNNQQWTLNVNLINTAINCSSISPYEIIGTSSIALSLATCKNVNSVVKATIVLSNHAEQLQIVINDINVIGGIAVGFTGSGSTAGSKSVQQMNFIQAFYNTNETLAQSILITLQLIMAINETEPLSGSETQYSGIWYPVYTVDKSTILVTRDEYAILSNLTQTTITITLTDSSYYINHVQSPLAKQPEVIFKTFLVTLIILEMSGLCFLISKLIIFPLIKFLFCRHKKLRTKIFGENEKRGVEKDEEYEMEEEKGHATNLEGQHHKSSG
ncbi:unnamed protein product [Rotaria magnacalcarata]